MALARALATSPKLLLLDEPLSALDAKVRVALRDELKALQRTLGITTVFVTHDQEEALSMSDRIVVMNEGRIEQLGTPFEIYNRPKTRFVASFIGTLNILNVEVVDAGSGAIRIAGQEARVGQGLAAAAGAGCAVALRPEAVTLQDPGNGCNRVRGTIEDVAFLGAVVRIKVGVGGSRILLDRFNSPRPAPAGAGRKRDAAFFARRPRSARGRLTRRTCQGGSRAAGSGAFNAIDRTAMPTLSLDHARAILDVALKTGSDKGYKPLAVVVLDARGALKPSRRRTAPA